MNVLFVMRSTVYARNFESTLRLLAERGHAVHIVAAVHDVLDPSNLVGRLSREYPQITHSAPPPRRATGWSVLGVELRRAIDYLRYRGPEYRDAPKLRRRADDWAPPFILTALRRPSIDTRFGRWLVGRLLRLSDSACPRDPDVEALIGEHRPDLVLVTPLVEPGSPQSEYVRSAHALGVRTGLCVNSWDNLTNKGLIQDALDVVTVWNEPMKREAIALHGVPADRIVVTGAVAYDHWFAWQPRTSRETFCARVGLDAARPYLLYLCSSKFIAPDELPFVRQWIRRIRESSSLLRDVGVLVRPHPQNTHGWREATFDDLDNVAVFPRAGANPVDTDSRADYFDSMHHSVAVVGVNTSAQIESAIVGRGVYAVLAPEFRETQEGTLHFQHLRDVNGGLLNVASDFAEHVAQLEGAVRDPQRSAERCRRFVEAFVRPHGVDQAASPRLVAALEETAARGARRRERGPWWAPLARPVLARAGRSVIASGRARARRSGGSSRKSKPGANSKSESRLDPLKEQKADRVVLARTAAAAFDHYLRVREHVRVMRQRDSSVVCLTPAEREVLSGLAVLQDASPDTIADLRHHCKAISGVRRTHYKGPKAASVQKSLERELLRVVEKGDDALLIEEPAALGGFGFMALGKRYNEDTLRFFRAISVLQDAALLKEFRCAKTRRTVWEIGGGWGGFAYQFKTLCPNVTYLITGTPDLFLASAVYLMAMFPAASFRFFDPADPDAFWRNWETVDFAFAPESAVPAMRPPSVDLTVDLMTLERMSASRAAMHVQRAHELGSRYVLSVCPRAGDGAEEASPIQPAVERFYWPHPVSSPLYLIKRLALGAATRGSIDRTYLLGWRRLHV